MARPFSYTLVALVACGLCGSEPKAWAGTAPIPSGCATTFAKLSSFEARAARPALEKLTRYLAAHPEIGHRIEIRPNGTAVLEIDYLERNQQKFMTLALRAIREGAVAEIDTGTLVGPKALTSVLALAESAGERPLKIHGNMMTDLASDVPAGAGLHTYADGITEAWTPTEIQQFWNAHQRLGFRECEAHAYICPFTLNTSRGRFQMQYANP